MASKEFIDRIVSVETKAFVSERIKILIASSSEPTCDKTITNTIMSPSQQEIEFNLLFELINGHVKINKNFSSKSTFLKHFSITMQQMSAMYKEELLKTLNP